ncbi:MAG: TRAP transporter substrate-binding protein [Candidatus Caldatribacterium sp.]|uniref:TRAP transporter substrate-binding protein n=1 Tax=Candidatus Caldatribacterium sp. TaxID=2282143 RepID=UPI00299C6561|nr:TRAP transporter substrate-binding protein [Candidatus Caldatribacterium sp.]MCX7730618.1 TRAP transporter substrate-binding protein [Candidatus Caldatribacterium sp.]MDW8081588.1 TRAP transporter substrate-binding protein [Candidatus Calescibacterium sp.]
MRRFLAILVLALFGAMAFSVASGEAKVVWKFGHLVNEEHMWHRTAVKFAELVKEKTNGEVEIVIYPNEQLGKEIEVLTMIQAGTADLTISGESMQNWAPKAALIAAPYAFRNIDHMVKAINSDIGQEIRQEIIEKVGVIPLYYHIRAPRNLTSNKPISKPEDVRGLRLRLPNVPLFVEAWKAVGASPQVMAFSEVFTALQQGVIDAQENPYDLIYNASLYEVQKYVNETEHVIGWVWVVLGKKQFESLSKELQEAVLAAAQEAQKYADLLFWQEMPTFKQKLIEKGMIINSAVDKEAFRKIMSEAVEKVLTPEQAALYRKIQELE